MASITTIFAFVFCLLILVKDVVSIDYGLALSKALLYYEAQRSGQLPANQRVQWRADSGLNDGKLPEVDLVGGYYDAGDNVKFEFPLAFTLIMLGWSVVEYGAELEAKGELSNALEAIKWGTDYLLKAHPQPNLLYGEVGDGYSDHQCWQRPEDMTTPRTAYKIDEQHPGADLAGETAAAFAAASLAFKNSNPRYSSRLLDHAKQLFSFATAYPGRYQISIGVAGEFYSSSGFEDEQLWAAAWLERATQDKTYAQYLNQATNNGGTRSTFSWDDKFIGAQVLVAKGLVEGRFGEYENLGQYKSSVEQFICNCVQKGSSNIRRSDEGLLWWDDFNNLQYVTSATFILTTYARILVTNANNITSLNCRSGLNSKNLSYMVGYGTNYPQKVHHRGASIVSIKSNSEPVGCQQGFTDWYKKDAPNPNVVVGAIVGGPDANDNYDDSRGNYRQNEAATANTAPFVGVLARLA